MPGWRRGNSSEAPINLIFSHSRCGKNQMVLQGHAPAIANVPPRITVHRSPRGLARCVTHLGRQSFKTMLFWVYQTKSLCCPSKNFVCSQPKDVGVRCSSTRITRYFFNPDTKMCQAFEYNGCEGMPGGQSHELAATLQAIGTISLHRNHARITV